MHGTFLVSVISVEGEHVLIKHGRRKLVHRSSLQDGPSPSQWRGRL